ncbi:MAG: hypothetical protein ACI4YB_00235 [Oscillospiraceae bacterium]
MVLSINQLFFAEFYAASVDMGIVEFSAASSDKKRSRIQLEINFIGNKGRSKHYIQSALNIDTDEKRTGEKLACQSQRTAERLHIVSIMKYDKQSF